MFGMINSVYAGDDWKGEPVASSFDVGAMTGLGILDATAGFSLLATASKKIIDRGFAPDVNDSVSVEILLGPVFGSFDAAFAFGGQLRWDFVKDAVWSFYSVGGLGGNYWNPGTGGRFSVRPRFGIGSFYKISEKIRARAEIASDFIGFGVNFAF